MLASVLACLLVASLPACLPACPPACPTARLPAWLLSPQARLPFFDGTLDLVHCVNSVKYLPLAEFEDLLFEWDRVLRVGECSAQHFVAISWYPVASGSCCLHVSVQVWDQWCCFSVPFSALIHLPCIRLHPSSPPTPCPAGGIIWFELFYAPKDEMKVYIQLIDLLGYKRLYWKITPKPDDDNAAGGPHVYLNAVIEKPVRAEPSSAEV